MHTKLITRAHSAQCMRLAGVKIAECVYKVRKMVPALRPAPQLRDGALCNAYLQP